MIRPTASCSRKPGADATVGRARAEALEREKLALYQRRYEEYTRVAKALQTLATASSATLPGPSARGEGAESLK